MKQDKKFVVVTGAAGLIGGRLVENLLQSKKEVLSVDRLTHFSSRPEQSQLPKQECMDRDIFLDWLKREGRTVQSIFHIGACTDTTETRWDYLKETNLDYSQAVWNLATQHRIPLVYASSAATYGDGSLGFMDEESEISKLEPLNLYGRSKQEFDLWALEQEKRGNQPPTWSGFKFFNVYGFGEAHKNEMASVIYKAYHQILKSGELVLFRSHRNGIADGEQKRDFISVVDVNKVLRFAAEKPVKRGIFNLGTGRAQSFLELAQGVFDSLGKKRNIRFVDTPIEIRDKYQYFTQAEMGRLRAEGYRESFHTLREGIAAYLKRLKEYDAHIR